MSSLLLMLAVLGLPDDLVTHGATLYTERQYEPALAAFKAAYAEQPAPELLYDMGLCAMALGRYQDALGYYADFLRLAEDADGRRRVAERIDETERALEASLMGAPVVAPPEPPFYRARWFWGTVAGTAVLSATVAAALHYRSAVETRPPSGTLGTVDRR